MTQICTANRPKPATERLRDELSRYQWKLLKRVFPAWILSSVVLFYFWQVADYPEDATEVSLRSVSGSIILSGFGVLATLVVAIQVLARSTRRNHKRSRPGPVEFLGWACWLVLLADTGLTTLAMLQSFDLSRWPNRVAVDATRAMGSLVFGVLIALFASDAAEHAERTDAYRRKEIQDSEDVLARMPLGHPTRRQQTIQAFVLLAGCPAISGIAAFCWFTPSVALAGTVVSALLGVVAFYSIRTLCVLHYLRRPWALLRHLAVGILFWALFGSAFLVGIFQAILGGAFGTDDTVVAEKLFRYIAFYVLVTISPFYAATWMCRTFGSKRLRGLVLNSAARGQGRKLLKLRCGRATSSVGYSVVTRHINSWLRQHEKAHKYLHKLRDNLPFLGLSGAGALIIAVLICLIALGPSILIAQFPRE
ncbi:hypothetical protein J7E83_17980 [Arthrobacter sp. ISL-48]|uniref:hypothetical protein n=1 Tax=Arthrobacter sp. ISL-48 TaxID=2819110 RepID=UPI001BEA3586|nr:hypothetical protein [Arthrobacter sp. ISL-48]MBT2533978.1 hypothetical protein [Arthrobacter sp. ISL-48]